MKRWLAIGIPIAIGLAGMIDIARHRFDPEHPSFIECLLTVLLFVSLIAVVRSGLDRDIPMSTASRMIRVFGGGFWALLLLFGIAAQIWNALR